MARLIHNTQPHNLTDFLKKIEESESKRDFKVGLEARSEQSQVCHNQITVSLSHKLCIQVWQGVLEVTR